MVGKDSRFGEFVAGEVRKYRSVYVPVKVNPVVCQFLRSARLEKVHPNPDDEFCDPRIGPNYGIMGEYQQQFRDARRHSWRYCSDPVIVENIRPDGYMLLNGHHRWGAALRLGYKSIPIKVVNLTQENDIKKLLENTKHTLRVTLDLDEVVFRQQTDALCEKKLPFPLNRLYPERLRLGIPALFHFFARSGYDIWVYSAKYYSMGYIKALFRKYRVRVSGVITGTARKGRQDAEIRKRLEQMIAEKYDCTVHIDNDLLVRIFNKTGAFDEHHLNADSPEWAHEIMQLVRGFGPEKS